MNSALSPREIQARIRAGASPAEVAAQAGLEEADIQGFAGPVLGEREFVANSALASTIRRRGENAHRNLGELVADRMRQRGIKAEEIVWDAWRQEDLRWRVVGVLRDEAGERRAEFIYDRKARLSTAHNADARWMIGEELLGAKREDENTIDLDDELALLRATKERPRPLPANPGQEVPDPEAMHDDFEDTSQLDELYDMLSGISEDSVRLYAGFVPFDDEPAESAPDDEAPAQEADEDTVVLPKSPRSETEPFEQPEAQPEDSVQDSLLAGEPTKPRKKTRRKGRASVPSWDEIMFGGR